MCSCNKTRKKKRVPFHIKNNLKKYEYDGTEFYAKNSVEAQEYIERLKSIKNKGIT